jgi:hypothetical protein
MVDTRIQSTAESVDGDDALLPQPGASVAGGITILVIATVALIVLMILVFRATSVL